MASAPPTLNGFLGGPSGPFQPIVTQLGKERRGTSPPYKPLRPIGAGPDGAGHCVLIAVFGSGRVARRKTFCVF